MFSSYLPSPILINFGPIKIYWYGLIMVAAILTGGFVAEKVAAKYYGIDKKHIWDLLFYLIIFGILGARIYEVLFVNWNYYRDNLSDIYKIWQGGLAIHGAIIAGAIVVWIYGKINKINLRLLFDIAAIGLVLGQAIGRWGNYFNQELFGLPTNLPWGIPIALENRPEDFLSFTHFHPTFLYESIGCLLIFFILLLVLKIKNKYSKKDYYFFNGFIALTYLILYPLLRFFLEFIKIDYTPVYFGLRLPQIISFIAIFLGVGLYLRQLCLHRCAKTAKLQ